jgi:hypothetical protein
LTLEGRTDKVRLLFIDGNVTGAESKKRLDDNRLGKILVKRGLIKEPDLQAALEEQKKTGAKVGNILIKNELAGKEVIEEIINSQISETVTQLFTWKQGAYEFTAQGVSQDRDFPFSLDTQHLLMDGLRIVDEWSLIKGKITLDTVFLRKTESPSGLTEREREIFGCVDGENDVSTITDLSGLDNFEVSKTLVALMEKGVIEAVEAAPVVPKETVVEARKPSMLTSSLPPLAIALSLVLTLGTAMIDRNYELAEFKASKTIGDLRFRIETFRFEHNELPRSLEQVSGSKDPWGRSFIYRVSDNTFHLSSPGADGREGTSDDIY